MKRSFKFSLRHYGSGMREAMADGDEGRADENVLGDEVSVVYVDGQHVALLDIAEREAFVPRRVDGAKAKI